MPTEAEASAWGMTIDEASGPPFEVWPDCVDAVNLFMAMGTQWVCGPGGVMGLNYVALPIVMRLIGIDRKNQSSVFEDLRVIESSALEAIAEKKAKQ